jgi:Holliday junction resolvase RusA-like endonuclease
MEIKFIVIGEPFGKKRPRARVIGGHAAIHNDPANERYELKVINAFQQVYPDNEYPIFPKGAYVGAVIKATYTIPKAYSKKQTMMAKLGLVKPTKKPDLDNIAKTILDALNGFVYHDDAQVVSLKIEKVYGDNANVAIEFNCL